MNHFFTKPRSSPVENPENPPSVAGAAEAAIQACGKPSQVPRVADRAFRPSCTASQALTEEIIA